MSDHTKASEVRNGILQAIGVVLLVIFGLGLAWGAVLLLGAVWDTAVNA